MPRRTSASHLRKARLGSYTTIREGNTDLSLAPFLALIEVPVVGGHASLPFRKENGSKEEDERLDLDHEMRP